MTDFDTQFLDHFTYAAREDDGYGPDHPRLGDKGQLARLSGLGSVLDVKDFEVAYDRFGLPGMRTSQTIGGRECTGMLGMQDVFADERLHVTLTERKPGDAFRERGRQYRYALEGVGYRLDPPFEEHVTRVYALAGSNTKNPVLGLFDFSTDMPVSGYIWMEDSTSRFKVVGENGTLELAPITLAGFPYIAFGMNAQGRPSVNGTISLWYADETKTRALVSGVLANIIR